MKKVLLFILTIMLVLVFSLSDVHEIRADDLKEDQTALVVDIDLEAAIVIEESNTDDFQAECVQYGYLACRYAFQFELARSYPAIRTKLHFDPLLQ